MGCCFSTSYCGYPFLDNYLHIRIKSIDGLRLKGDVLSVCSAGGDLYIRVSYRGNVQSTKIKKICGRDCVFNESLILKSSKPSENDCIKIELIDFDHITGDDVLGVCHIQGPDKLNKCIEEKRFRLIGKEGKSIGGVSIDHFTFIKQKINKYDGPFKACCCLFCCQNVGQLMD